MLCVIVGSLFTGRSTEVSLCDDLPTADGKEDPHKQINFVNYQMEYNYCESKERITKEHGKNIVMDTADLLC